MRNLMLSGLAVLALLSAAGAAWARDGGDDISRAVTMCRAEIAGRAGVELDQVTFSSVRTRSRVYQVSLHLSRAGERQTIRCDVSRGQNLAVAALTPDLPAIAAQAPAPAAAP